MHRLHLPVCIAALVLLATAGPASATDVETVVAKMLEAHGGYDTWANSPSVSFDESMTIRGGTRSARVVVEQGARRSTMVGDGYRVGWDGETCWSVGWTAPAPPRFMAQLNFYFYNLPWLVRDDGVRLAYEGTTTILDEPTEYHAVRMTFEAGTGDSPDDYYVLYVHPETFVLHATEYIVTYAPILPEGVTSSPVHVLVFEDHATVDGLLVPHGYTIHNLDGSVYASSTATAWDFEAAFDPSTVAMPEGATVDTSMD